MIDLHCHILWGMDDGATSLEESVAMARMAAEGGMEIVAATPHCNIVDDDPLLRCRVIREKVKELNRALQERKIPLRIVPGMELYVRENLDDILEKKAVLPLNDSRYLLAEFDFSQSADFMADSLRKIHKAGYIPVLAHPERYEAVQRDENFIPFCFRQGTVIQVNKESVLGKFGKAPKMAADRILSRGLAHIVASDAHGTRSRTPGMGDAMDFLVDHYSESYAAVLLGWNPARILENKPVVKPESELMR